MAPPHLSFAPRPSVFNLGLARAGAKHVAKTEKRHKAKSASTKFICGIYCMIACVFGAVFPISDALAQTESGQHLYYTEVFHCFMYGLGVIAYIYFLNLIMLQRRKLAQSGRLEEIELDVYAGMGSAAPSRRVSRVQCSHGDLGKRLIEKESSPMNSQNVLPRHEPQNDMDMDDLENDTDITYEAEGVNFYLRLGAMGFGVGGMVQSGFKISEPFENPNSLKCRSILFLVNAGLYLVFVFLQTFFIFKYHKVVIHKHKAFVRFCLMHILATNLSVWLSTTTHETAEDLGRVSAKRLAGGGHGDANFTDGGLGGGDHSSPNLNQSIIYYDSEGHRIGHIIDCHHIHTLSDRSAPYLFPCLIEYSLIGAAVAYRTFLNVGKRIAKGDPDDEDTPAYQSLEPVECHKSNRGLFMGLLMLLLTLVSVALFFVFDEDKHKKDISTGIFLSSEIFLFVVSTLACIIGLCYTSKLAYVGLFDEDFFDDKLLLIAQMGVYLLSTCHAISSATSLSKTRHSHEGTYTLPIMYFCMAILNFIQSSIQSVFILDGLRRGAATDEHMTKKPGRAVITFLLVCNLAMWTVNTFEIKKAEVVDIHVDFFRYMPWSIIMHLCVPLVIFYRFHSSVCLSDVWHKAYIKRELDEFSLSEYLEDQVKRKKLKLKGGLSPSV